MNILKRWGFLKKVVFFAVFWKSSILSALTVRSVYRTVGQCEIIKKPQSTLVCVCRSRKYNRWISWKYYVFYFKDLFTVFWKLLDFSLYSSTNGYWILGQCEIIKNTNHWDETCTSQRKYLYQHPYTRATAVLVSEGEHGSEGWYRKGCQILNVFIAVSVSRRPIFEFSRI